VSSKDVLDLLWHHQLTTTLVELLAASGDLEVFV
jgi:hypothetical protein